MESIEDIRKEMLRKRKEEYAELGRGIAELEYEIRHPPPPLDHDKIKKWVDPIIARDKELGFICVTGECNNLFNYECPDCKAKRERRR